MADLPPSYDNRGPPAYQGGSALPTFILDGDKIFSIADKHQPIYTLSNPLATDNGVEYTLEKVLREEPGAARDSKGQVLDPENARQMYQFRMSVLGESEGRNVLIEGTKTGVVEMNAYESAALVPSIVGWHSCVVHGHFSAKLNCENKLIFGEHLGWKDLDGKLLAVETLAVRDGKGIIVKPPRLVTQSVMGQKDLDLLVVCWLARAWKQAQKEIMERTTKGKIKKFFDHGKSKDPERMMRMDVAAAAGKFYALGSPFGGVY